MDARILFLGTGGDIFVIGKQQRTSGGILLNFENNQFHLDPGPGSLVMAKMMNVNLRENTAIFITRNTIFSAGDANAIISAMTHDGLDKRGVLVCPSSVVSETDKIPGPLVNSYYQKCLEKTLIIDNTKRIGINNIEVEVIHLSDGQSCGFKFITQKFVLGYITETEFTEHLVQDFQECDILIICVRDPRNVKSEVMNSENAEHIITKCKPQLAILTGFGIKMIQAEPLYEARDIQRNTGVQIIAAKDGMTINPVSFSTTVRQRKLKSY